MTWNLIKKVFDYLRGPISPSSAPSAQAPSCRAGQTCSCKSCTHKTAGSDLEDSIRGNLKFLLIITGKFLILVLQVSFLMILRYVRKILSSCAKPVRKRKQVAKTRARTPSEDPKHPPSPLALARDSQRQFDEFESPDNLDQAIKLYEIAVQSQILEEDTLAEALFTLALDYRFRFERSKEVADLNRVIHYHRRGVKLCSPISVMSIHHHISLFHALILRDEPLSDAEEVKDVAKALAVLQSNLPRDHVCQRPIWITSQAIPNLHSKSEDGLAHADQAILWYKEALEDVGKEGNTRALLLSWLAATHFRRFKQSREVEDAESTLSYNIDVLNICSPEDPKHPQALKLTDATLSEQYDISGDLSDLQDAIKSAQSVFDSLPPNIPAPRRVGALLILSKLYRIRYSRLADRSEVNDGVAHLENAARLARSYPGDYLAYILRLLADALFHGFVHDGDIIAFDKHISYSREALNLLPPNHPARAPLLDALAMALNLRVNIYHNKSDYDEAVQLHTEVLTTMTTTDKDYPRVLIFLAHALINKTSSSGEVRVQDLKEAELYLRQVVDLRPEAHPTRAHVLATLAGKNPLDPDLLRKAVQHELEDIYTLPWEITSGAEACPQNRFLTKLLTSENLDEEVAQHFQTTDKLSDNRLIQAVVDLTLAKKCVQSTNLNASKDGGDKIVFHLERVANVACLGTKKRLIGAISWAEAARRYSHDSELRAHKLSLSLLNQLAMISHTIESKHGELSNTEVSFAATTAASCAISLGDLETAVELLEQGRAIIWSQAGRYKTPLDQLKAVDPELAKEFRRVSVVLEGSAVSTNALSSKTPEDYRTLTRQREGLVEQIRTQDEFSNFLTTTPFSTLRMAAVNGPVVIINIDIHRSDAIILHPTSPPTLVSLPEAGLEVIHSLVGDLSEARFMQEEEPCQKNVKIQRVLQSLWNIIVDPIVKELRDNCGLPLGSRVWWCPTGHLWHLPLHAAGPYKQGQRNLPDIFVSSYTPTLSALLRSNDRPAGLPPRTSPTVLLVGQTQTPGEEPLPNAGVEIGEVKGHIPSAVCMDGKEASRDAVLDGLQRSSWVHLSCHGHIDPEQPFKSGFSLHDGLLTILDLTKTGHQYAELAFLSACHSAAGNLRAPDEAIHLAAGLQFSGFAGVVGTLWAMADIDGPDLARDFYGYMVRESGGELDYRNAAAALNFATKEMRKRKVPLDRWINFIHVGA